MKIVGFLKKRDQRRWNYNTADEIIRTNNEYLRKSYKEIKWKKIEQSTLLLIVN